MLLQVSGNVAASFDETPDLFGDQTLTLNGSGLSPTNQNFLCFGLYSGSTTISTVFKGPHHHHV